MKIQYNYNRLGRTVGIQLPRCLHTYEEHTGVGILIPTRQDRAYPKQRKTHEDMRDRILDARSSRSSFAVHGTVNYRQ